jgi:hypothetical protein
MKHHDDVSRRAGIVMVHRMAIAKHAERTHNEAGKFQQMHGKTRSRARCAVLATLPAAISSIHPGKFR